jgi:hypothetical protein
VPQSDDRLLDTVDVWSGAFEDQERISVVRSGCGLRRVPDTAVVGEGPVGEGAVLIVPAVLAGAGEETPR